MNDNSLNLNQNLFPPNSPYTQAQQTYGFQFDYQNEAGIVSNSKVRNISADKIAAGTVLVGINLGSSSSGYILLDGTNNTIIVNDGTNDRVLIGFGDF